MTRKRYTTLLGAALIGATATVAHPQAATQPALTTQPNADELITLNFPENVELRVLIEYVSQRLGINIFYDQQAVAQQITLRAPASISKDSLLDLLSSILQAKGLALVDAEQPGWKRIVSASTMMAVAKPATAPATRPAGASSSPVTLVLKLTHADPQKAEQLVKPFLTQPGGNSVALGDQQLLILTDFGSNITRLADLVQLIDRPQKAVLTRFVLLSNLDAAAAAAQVSSLLAAQQRARGAGAVGLTAAEVIAEPRTNQLILIGSDSDVAAAEAVAKSLDIALPLETRVYALSNASPERLDALARQLVGEARATYQSSVDPLGNVLVVRATASMHATLEQLKQQIDTAAASPSATPIRFYRLENTTAAEALATIEAIASDAQPVSESDPSETADRPRGRRGGNTAAGGESRGDGSDAGRSVTPPLPDSVFGRVDSPRSGPARESAARAVHTRDAVVTADANTNSIIVVGKPESQKFFEELIEMLDKRRPQVLIECTVVTLDTTNDFSFGVEISAAGSTDNAEIISFSSFGLSRVGTGADLGRLNLIPGLGFNGALISTDIADVVVKALITSGRAEVVSAPRILVNDNATGSLASVQEAPFTSVNASQTIATTSFGGYASAGTSINLTPHVSEGDFLQLEYTIALNSFTGAGTAGTPPPRQTNQLQSKVTIPDGSTIIVGGLNRRDRSRTKDAIPWIGEIPFVEYFFSSRTTREVSSTLFVFIRPVILRDDQFADLKFYSRQGTAAAELPPEHPIGQPMLMR